MNKSELVDAIAELSETGSSLRANNLRVVDIILESTTQFIANHGSLEDSWKKKKIQEIALLLTGALAAESRVGLKMNLEKKNLSKILSLLPSLKSPTIASLSDEGWIAVETIIEEKIVRKLIPQLKQAGAFGIVEYSLNKIVD